MAGSTFQTNPVDLIESPGRLPPRRAPAPGLSAKLGLGRGSHQEPDRFDLAGVSGRRADDARHGRAGQFQAAARRRCARTAKRPRAPKSLLLDGQQRMTSLYQVTLRKKVVETVTPKKKKVQRWFYIDIRKALDPAVDREEAIIGVPEDRSCATDFGREVGPGSVDAREGVRRR